MRVLLFLGVFASTLSFSHAENLRDRCLQSANIDRQHSCACDSVREKPEFDLSPFDLHRPDLQRAFQSIANAPKTNLNPEEQEKLTFKLREKYEQERNTLSCHNNTVAQLSHFVMMENYCVVNSQNPDTRCTSNSLNQDRKDFDAHLKSDQVAIAEQKLTSQIERYLGSNDSKIEKLSQCEEEPFLRITEQVAILQPHCKISLEAFFPNNISDLNAAVKSKIITAIRADACYRSKVAMKGDELDLISKIEISTSSSLLANTGEAAHLSFLELSQRRAQTISEILRSEFHVEEKNVSLNYQGTNAGEHNAGTSGPCPYRYDSGQNRWSLKKEFQNNLQILDPYKKVSVALYFESLEKAVVRRTSFRSIYRNCTRVSFKCSENLMSNRSPL